jgi:hypothetical protein
MNFDVGLSVLMPFARLLGPFSVQFRYPGDAATDVQTKDAIATLRQLRKIMRRKMGF